MDRHDVGPSLDFDTEYLRVRVVQPSGDQTAVRLVVTGEVDGGVARQLAAVVSGAQSLWRPTTIEVDLAAVTFLDSAGIRCLFNCREIALNAGGDLILADPTPDVHRVLEITGLLQIFGLPVAAPRKARRFLSSN